MILFPLGAPVLAASLVLSQPLTPREAFEREILIERQSALSEIAVERAIGKLYIEAQINGEAGGFIFDTGSPTIVSRTLADRLGLQSIGQNTGRDAHGAEVVMEIAVVETLSLGEVVFHDVPVLIFDFETLDQGACFARDGVIGSEILKGSAWRLDLSRQTLSITADSGALPALPDGPETTLYDFGYPHMPILDYAIGEMQDKALFDTGFAGELALLDLAADTPAARRALVRGSLQRGLGRAGESAGGWSEPEALTRFRVEGVTLGEAALPELEGDLRPLAPTLFGAALLNTYAITLDYPGGRFSLSPLAEPLPAKPAQDFSIALVGDQAELIRLYDDTPAARAGLEVGDTILAIDDRTLETIPTAARCETALWLADELDAQTVQSLTVRRDGESRTITIGPER